MESIPESRSRSKKTKRLGQVRVIRPEQYEAFDVDSKLECIRALIPLGLMRIHELLEDEVCALAGARYTRKAAHLPGRRHGSNPGSVDGGTTEKSSQLYDINHYLYLTVSLLPPELPPYFKLHFTICQDFSLLAGSLNSTSLKS